MKREKTIEKGATSKREGKMRKKGGEKIIQEGVRKSLRI